MSVRVRNDVESHRRVKRNRKSAERQLVNVEQGNG